MNHRLFCVLERDAEDLGGSSIVCIDGLSKPPRRCGTRGTTDGSSATAPSSRSGGLCWSSRSARTGRRPDLQVKSAGKCYQGRKRGVRLVCREEATDRLGLQTGAAGQLRLGEMQFLATGIKGADHRIDLPDSLPGLLVRPAVLRILEATSEVALCAGLCCGHVLRVAVTSTLRIPRSCRSVPQPRDLWCRKRSSRDSPSSVASVDPARTGAGGSGRPHRPPPAEPARARRGLRRA